MELHIPTSLLPRDGRFGSGPSKVRQAQVDALSTPHAPLGTSHRKPAVKNIVAQIQDDLTQLYRLPDGYEVLLGNGGASLLWDAIAFCVADKHTQNAVFGEFSGKAAKAMAKVPWIEHADIIEEPTGSVAICRNDDNVDTYLYPHNETSTGAFSPIARFGNTHALTLVDATSAAGGVDVDISLTDMYYFSPQKCFGADGGLWFSLTSPRTIERIERLEKERWIPDILSLPLALKNARKNQTLNTPSLANLIMMSEQTSWMLENGGLTGMETRTRASSQAIYSWAHQHDYASPFINDEQYRSPVVATIDFDDTIDANALSSFLRTQGILDIDPYRSLGRNQLRIGVFPAVELNDVEALLACIDWAIDNGIGVSQ